MPTEQEAKKQFCCGAPIIFAAIMAASKSGAISDLSAFGRCAASECMAWRWKQKQVVRDVNGVVVRDASPVECIDRNKESYDYVDSDFGFCGLVGKDVK